MSIAEQEIHTLLGEYEAAANRHLFAAVEPFIHPDATFRFSDGDYVGLDAIRGAFDKTWSTWEIEDERYTLSDLTIVHRDSRCASVTYVFHWSGVVDGKPFKTRGRGTNVIVRNGEKLQLIHEHLSS